MKLRLFIALNIPRELKLKLKLEREYEFIKKALGDLPVRFLDSQNWHFTLSFLGYQEEMILPPIVEAIRKIASQNLAPEIELESLSYGPREQNSPPATARMIWLNGNRKTSVELSHLKSQLERELIDSGVKFRMENRQFQCHLTLARFDAVSVKKLPSIEKPFSYRYRPETLDLMESRLKRTGAEYSALERFAFKKAIE